MSERLRIGLIGAGGNTRAKHIPGFQAIPGVELIGVCNRRSDSTLAVAREFSIPRTYTRWQEVVADPDIDAIVIGTWPYLHAPITIAALSAGKNVLCEARMAMNAREARQMLTAAQATPDRVAMLVPSPFGLVGDRVVRDRIARGEIGSLREVQVNGMNGALADPDSPLSWRQSAALSGVNMLTLGILHETLLRWVPGPTRVLAQGHAFVPSRIDPETGVRRPVETPDSVQVMTILSDGSRATYHFSGAIPFGGSMSIALYGTKGSLIYDLQSDRIQQFDAHGLQEITIPVDQRGGWRVEQDFVEAIRHRTPIEYTSFATGVAYMEFTEAVARSAATGKPVELPLD